MMSLLTDSKKNEIKRMIAVVFNESLRLATLKKLICLQPYVRSEKE